MDTSCFLVKKKAVSSCCHDGSSGNDRLFLYNMASQIPPSFFIFILFIIIIIIFFFFFFFFRLRVLRRWHMTIHLGTRRRGWWQHCFMPPSSGMSVNRAQAWAELKLSITGPSPSKDSPTGPAVHAWCAVKKCLKQLRRGILHVCG